MTPGEFAELHALARAGDAGAMNRLILGFERWVRFQARFPPPYVDRDDAESMAREAVWAAARDCTNPQAVPAFARMVFRNEVYDARKRADRSVRAESVGTAWDDVAGNEVRYATDLRCQDGVAEPCFACGTTDGYTPPRRLRPLRVKGLCSNCYLRRFRKIGDEPA